MAISRDKKNALVTELTELFDNAKLSVGAVYTGLNVSDLQDLRKLARDENVTIKVAKNRLVRVALTGSKKLSKAETSSLTGQIVYAFSSVDETAPAQILAKFAKEHPQLQLVIGFNDEGKTLDQTTIQTLATLPSKDQLRGQLVGVIAAPLTGFLTVTSGVERGFVQVLSRRAETL